MQEIFTNEEGEGVGLLVRVDNNFLMSLGLILPAVVELTNKVDSLLCATFSATIEESYDSLISTINSFKIS